MSTNQDWQQPQPPQPSQGMGGGTKVLLIIGGIFGVLALICCGGVGFIGYKYSQALSEDPVEVVATTSAMADVEIPPGFSPKARIDLWWPPMKMAFYEGGTEQGMIMLMQIDRSMVGADPEQMRAQMNQAFQQQGGQQGQQPNVQVQTSETKELTVRGAPASFTFGKGTNTQNNEEFWQVSGTFEGKEGIVVLMIIVPTASMSEQQIIDFIESIQ